MVYRNKPSEQEARQEMCFGLVCFSLLSFLTFRARPTLSNLVSQTLACTRAKILDKLKIRPSLERPVCSVLLFFFFFVFHHYGFSTVSNSSPECPELILV